MRCPIGATGISQVQGSNSLSFSFQPLQVVKLLSYYCFTLMRSQRNLLSSQKTGPKFELISVLVGFITIEEYHRPGEGLAQIPDMYF